VAVPSAVPVRLELVEIGVATTEAAPAAGQGPRTVLVVDDDRDVRELVARKLKQAGFAVVTAEDGVAALDAVAAHKPDLMLLDVMMPGMSGVDVCRTLRAEQGEGAPAVIFLSAKSQPADIEVGMAAGAEDYVVKPFSPKELVERTEAVLARA
jgi:DNA-binding response OmpR family regulator